MKRGVATAIVAVITLAILGYGAYLWTNSNKPAEPAENPSSIEISDFEQRIFKTLTLKNGLKVVLVSDPESDKAAAALNVFSGSWANPEDIPGMAHFLEHMLFLGTEKFPEVDGYQHFIEQNGGSDNAYTSSENTLYFFDIRADQLDPALDRFSQFFIAPLFDPQFSERERNAVNSEYSASLQNDYRRIEDVVRELINPDHPASRLAIGTLETLTVADISDRLQRFFNEHYVASNMSLAIYGPQDIESLEQMANEYFNGIRAVDKPQQAYVQPLFQAAELPKLVEIKPRKEMRQLEFRFPIGPTAAQQDSRPGQYLAHLIGHESTGSLLSVLKEKGWAENLYASGGDLTHSNTSFDVRIELTPAGLDNWQAVADLLFSQIELIRNQGIQQWIFDEQKNINEIDFQFSENVSPGSTVVTLAERLRYFPENKVLSGPYRLGEFDPSAVQLVLNQLKADNALVLLTHPEANTDRASQYYQTPYRAQMLTGNTVANWRSAGLNAELKLPQPNPFVPTELSVLPLETPPSTLFNFTPQKVAIDDHKTLWFEQDDEFRTPKIDIHLLLETDYANLSADNAVAVNLYLKLVNDALNEVRYEAGLAGSGYSIGLVDKGIQIRLYGYQNKLNLLLDTLLLELVEHTIQGERLQIVREEYLRDLRNRVEDSVAQQMFSELSEWMLSNTYAREDLIKALQKTTKDSLTASREQWLSDSYLTMLMHGNLLQQQAIDLAERIDAVIPQSGLPASGRSVADIPSKQYLAVKTIDHNDSALLQYYQGENSSLRERATYALLAEMINAPYFAELRTREQLGYIVMARPYPIDGLPGMVLYVQSPGSDAALVQLYSDRFLNRFAQQLKDMNENQFLSYKQGLMTSLSEPDKNLYQLSSRYWYNIQQGNKNFNTNVRIANEVGKISLDGLTRFYNNQILGDQKSSLTLHQVGKGMTEAYRETDDNIVGFYRLNDPKQWPDEIRWVQPSFNNLSNTQ